MYKIIENVFSKTEIDYLKDVFEKRETLKLYTFRPDTGRISITMPPNSIKPEIVAKVQEIIKSVYGKDYEIKDIGFQRYKLQYGIPNLKPHIDDQKCQIVFDYQIESNKNWDLVVEGESISLNDNDAVVFEGEKDVHWRNPVHFKSHEYVSMLNFNAVDKDHWSNFTEIDPIGPEDLKKIRTSIAEKWKNNYPIKD
jgi:hypothetical protein